jgi:hypothetical protein
MKAYCENCKLIQPSSFSTGNDVLTGASYEDLCCNICDFIVATVQEREATPQHEWVGLTDEKVHPTSCDCMGASGFNRVEYYTAPPKREWVGLTDEDKQELDEKYGDDYLAHLNAVETKLKEKNNG